MSVEAYLGLGSNIEPRKENIQKVLELLNMHESIEICAVSSLIETKAVSKFKQPDFLNAVMKINTTLSPHELLLCTQKIEKLLGRVSKGNNAPRKIDIDILFYGQEIVCEEGDYELTIPHPLCHEREFVLRPMCEIAPEFIHPVFQEKIETLYLRLTTSRA